MQQQRPFPSVVFLVGWRDRDRAHEVLRADRKAWQLEHDLPTE